MPTKPIEIILPRKTEPEEFEKFLIECATYLEEVVNYGTNVIHWVSHHPKFKSPDVDIVPLMLARNIVEIGDAISILVRQSAVDPSKILLRAAFEILLYTKFITSEQSENRCKAYLVCYIFNKKNEYSRFKSGTNIHQNFKHEIQDDEFIETGYNPFTPELDRMAEGKIKNLEEWILYDHLQKTVEEYKRFKKKNDGKKFPWYSLYGGERDLARLAKMLRYRYLYEVLYRHWSESVHSSDLITGKLSGSKEFYQIRLGRDAKEVISFAIKILFLSYRHLIEFNVPEIIPDFNKWYNIEMREFVRKLDSTTIKII